MLNISSPELIVLMIIGLVILGPRKLPGIARSVGRGLRELQKALYTMYDAADAEQEPEKTAPAPQNRQPESSPSPSQTIIPEAAPSLQASEDSKMKQNPDHE